MRRFPILFAFVLVAAAARAEEETCPPVPDHREAFEQLFAALRQAPDEATARALMDDLWWLWVDAPDDRAQAMLDEGMRRRAGYDFLGAIEEFDALIAYCPHYAEGYNQRAFARFLRGEYEMALEDLDRALELSPRHIGALAGRALTLIFMERHEAGQKALREALKMNPFLPERSYLVGEMSPPETDL